jgi:hypothetical protein
MSVSGSRCRLCAVQRQPCAHRPCRQRCRDGSPGPKRSLGAKSDSPCERKFTASASPPEYICSLAIIHSTRDKTSEGTAIDARFRSQMIVHLFINGILMLIMVISAGAGRIASMRLS